MNYNLWVEQQIDYRFSNSAKTRLALLPRHQQIKTTIKTLAICLPTERRYAALNALDKICQFDADRHVFFIPKKVREKKVLGGRYVRDAQFANLVLSWGFSAPFLTNWGDAQGWNYEIAVPELDDLLIMQFSRRKQQRGRVVLFPLGHRFMGADSNNIPTNFDNLNFRHKKDCLVWRGRYSGVFSNWKDNFFWAASLIRKNESQITEEVKAHHERYQAVKIMDSVDGADVGFTLSKNELDNVRASAWKKNFLVPYVKPRLSIAEQIQNKFILALPGNDYPSSLYWSLLSNSVVFLLENEWETALDSGLQPWVHYVPLELSRADISEKFERMVSNPKLCLEIIENAHQYMLPFLNHDLRDAADYETLRSYQEKIIPILTLDKKYSFSRG